MSCPAISQIPLAAIVYLWAWAVLVAWSFRHARAAPGGKTALVFLSFFWPLTVLLLATRRGHNVQG